MILDLGTATITWETVAHNEVKGKKMEPGQTWWDYAAIEMGIPLVQVPVIVLSAAAVYLAFTLIVRVFGARALTTSTTSDAVVVIMLGAVAGRGIMGLEPTVAAALVALLTLFTLEMLFHGVQYSKLMRHFTNASAVVVFANGEEIEEACRRTRTSTADLVSAMRGAGISEIDSVQAIILEPSGGYSVIKAGETMSSELLEGVDGAEYLVED